MATNKLIYGNTITLPNGNTLSIPHINLKLNERNRVIMQLEDGWVFYNTDSFPKEIADEDISYSRYGVYSPDFDYNKIVVVDETTVNQEQIN